MGHAPGGIALPKDVYDLQPVDVEVILYSYILNATVAEQEALQQTAFAQIEARALATFADKLWKDTWGARVFFAQFKLDLQELGLSQVVEGEDFPATKRAYVELLMTFLPSDGKKAIISISKSTDKEVLRKLDHFTAAVTKWHEVVWAFQLLQQSSAACSARELRRFDRDNRPSFPSITRVLRTTVEDAKQQPSRHKYDTGLWRCAVIGRIVSIASLATSAIVGLSSSQCKMCNACCPSFRRRRANASACRCLKLNPLTHQVGMILTLRVKLLVLMLILWIPVSPTYPNATVSRAQAHSNALQQSMLSKCAFARPSCVLTSGPMYSNPTSRLVFIRYK